MYNKLVTKENRHRQFVLKFKNANKLKIKLICDGTAKR